jgi:hypothetical protein
MPKETNQLNPLLDRLDAIERKVEVSARGLLPALAILETSAKGIGTIIKKMEDDEAEQNIWEYANRTLTFYPITSLPTPEMMADEIAKRLKDTKKKDGNEDEWKKKLLELAESIKKKADKIPELAKESTLLTATETVVETKEKVGKIKNDTALIPLLIKTD